MQTLEDSRNVAVHIASSEDPKAPGKEECNGWRMRNPGRRDCEHGLASPRVPFLQSRCRGCFFF